MFVALVLAWGGYSVWAHSEATRRAATRLQAAHGAAGLGIEPIREAVQLTAVAWPAAAFADVPGGWPVIAATRSVPHWKAFRAPEASR